MAASCGCPSPAAMAEVGTSTSEPGMPVKLTTGNGTAAATAVDGRVLPTVTDTPASGSAAAVVAAETRACAAAGTAEPVEPAAPAAASAAAAPGDASGCSGAERPALAMPALPAGCPDASGPAAAATVGHAAGDAVPCASPCAAPLARATSGAAAAAGAAGRAGCTGGAGGACRAGGAGVPAGRPVPILRPPADRAGGSHRLVQYVPWQSQVGALASVLQQQQDVHTNHVATPDAAPKHHMQQAPTRQDVAVHFQLGAVPLSIAAKRDRAVPIAQRSREHTGVALPAAARRVDGHA